MHDPRHWLQVVPIDEIAAVIFNAVDADRLERIINALAALHQARLASEEPEAEPLDLYADALRTYLDPGHGDQSFEDAVVATTGQQEASDADPDEPAKPERAPIVCFRAGCDQVRPKMRGRPPMVWFCPEHA
jgi:hypothetical protein